MSTLKIKVIVGSTRANRFSEKPAQWIFDDAKKPRRSRRRAARPARLPAALSSKRRLPPGLAKDNYDNPVVVKWREKIREADGFIICTPEYNHGYPAVLKNALDYVYFGVGPQGRGLRELGRHRRHARRRAAASRGRGARHGADPLGRAHPEPVVHPGRERHCDRARTTRRPRRCWTTSRGGRPR